MNGAERSSLTALERAAYDSLNDFAGSSLVFLAEGAIGASAAAPNGSGTLLQTLGGRIFVLTARHVLEDDPPDQHALDGRAIKYGIADALGKQFWHPTVFAKRSVASTWVTFEKGPNV